MFLRFVSTEFCEDSGCRLGIFQAAFQLLDSGCLAVLTNRHDCQTCLIGLKRTWSVPIDSADRSRRAAQPKAICWFRPTAKVHLAGSGKWSEF